MAETAWFTYDDFADRVGEQFRLRTSEAQGLALVLSSATASDVAAGVGPDGAPRQQFSLVFRGPDTPRLSQGVWELEHDAMGDVVLFLVPIQPDAEGPLYEAVFG